jgi:hypothetical protein
VAAVALDLGDEAVVVGGLVMLVTGEVVAAGEQFYSLEVSRADGVAGDVVRNTLNRVVAEVIRGVGVPIGCVKVNRSHSNVKATRVGPLPPSLWGPLTLT